jgi:hypothetical protein
MSHEPTRDPFSQQKMMFRLEESRRDFPIAIAAVVLRVEKVIEMRRCTGVESPVGAS